MKALVLVSPKKLEIRDIPPIPLQNFEVRIKIHKTSICGSDIKNFNNPLMAPLVPGHEFSGEVVELLTQSEQYTNIGARVTAYPMIGCMECEACQKGIYRDCNSKQSLGFQLPGSFAEYITVDSRFLIKLHDEISYNDGALLEHLACGYRLVREMVNSKISVDSSIVIIGDGPIALANIQFLILFKYCNITLIGKHKIRKLFAKKIGIKNVIDYRTLPDNMPLIDVCIYSAKADKTLKQIAKKMNPTAFFFSQTRIEDNYLKNIIMRKFIWGRAFAYMIEDFDEVMKLIKKNKIKTKDLVTKEIKFDNLLAVQDIFLKKNYHIKMILTVFD